MAMDKDRLGQALLDALNALGPAPTPIQIWTAIADEIIKEINDYY